MGFGLLSFQKKGTKKKKSVQKVLLQQKPLIRPQVPSQHITTLLFIFVFLPSKPYSQPSTVPHTSTGRNQTLNPRLLQTMKPSLPRRNPDFCT